MRKPRSAVAIAGVVPATLAAGLLVAAAGPAGAAAGPTITTVAGGAGHGAGSLVFQVPDAVAAGPDGAVYVADERGAVRALSTGSATETVAAGVEIPGYAGDGGAATAAELGDPAGVATGPGGLLVIADAINNRVRVVAGTSGKAYGLAMTAGHIYTIAGNGTAGSSGSGGLATAAELDDPEGVAVDAAGNLVIADSGDNQIQVVAAKAGTFYGLKMAAGHLYTVAGDGQLGYSGDGGPAIRATLDDPPAVAAGADGSLVIADGDRIRVIAARAGTYYGRAIAAGDIDTVAGNGTAGLSGNGGKATAAELDDPEGLAVDAAGNLVIADSANNEVQVVAASSASSYGRKMAIDHIYAVAGTGTAGAAGTGGLATAAELSNPSGVTIDSAGNLVIADTGNDLVRVLAAQSGTFYGQAMTAEHLYTVAGNGTTGFSGNGGPAASAEFAQPFDPAGVTATSAGNYLVSDATQVRMVAAASGTYFGQAMTAGDIYAVAGSGKPGLTGNGGPATAARLNYPEGLALDGSGNLVIADSSNSQIRVVAAVTGTFYGQAMTAGDIYAVAGNGTAGLTGNGGPATAAELSLPGGVAVDGAGNLVIADTYNNEIRVVAATTGTFYGQAMTAGHIYEVAGDGTFGFSGEAGPATAAELAYPDGVTVDSAGNLVMADSTNNRIRVVAAAAGTDYGVKMKAGYIYTIAGNGTAGYAGDGGPAAKAELSLPAAVEPDASGNLLIADADNSRIRVIAAHAGTFYGVKMTAGDIYTIAGSGTSGFTGNGGPATAAELASPGAVAPDGKGKVLIADTGNFQVRLVS